MTKAFGSYGAAAEGRETEALGQTSHAQGFKTIAKGRWQDVMGTLNLVDNRYGSNGAGGYAQIIGNGYQKYGLTGRSNAYALDWDGNGFYAGDLYVNAVFSDNGNDTFAVSGNKVATLLDVNNTINNIITRNGNGTIALVGQGTYAYSLQYGYTDGLSYITCKGTSVDNYAAYIYYQVLKVYIHTGKEVYYKMSEFIQQNTKSTMDWDGTLGFAYKSLTPEASTVWSGTSYDSALDGRGEMGVWLPWQSVANAEPIAKMYDTFGSADVLTYKNTSLSSLRSTLKAYGVGGKTHRKY
jgi:hypothetical protein